MKQTQHPPIYLRGFNCAGDLLALRKRAGLTQAQLADLSGFARHAVIYHEKRTGRVDGVAPRRFREALAGLGLIAPLPGQAPLRLASAMPRRQSDVCGAKTRTGSPCQCKPVKLGGRCKYHGGLSTGPRTPEGKARVVAARLRRAAGQTDDFASNTRARDGVSPMVDFAMHLRGRETSSGAGN